MSTNTTVISVKLPLPLDVAATITKLIGTAYPNAKMQFAEAPADHMNIIIDLEDRIDDEDDLESVLEKFEKEPIDPSVGESTYTKYGVEPPQWLVNAIGAVAAEYLEDAENYKQTSFHLVHNGQEMVMTVARSEEQTPHALRTAAEARVQKLEEALRQAGIDPSQV